MRITTAGTLAALAATVSAFVDTAPFAIFASEDVSKSFKGFGELKKPVVPAEDLPTFNCPSVDHVLILTQLGVNVADFHGSSNFAPLKKAIKSAKYSMQVPEVTGRWDHNSLYEKLAKECGHQVVEPKDIVHTEGKTVWRTEMEALDGFSAQDRGEKGMAERKFALAKDDTTLLNVLPNFSDKSYMVIYAGLPNYTPPSHAEAAARPSKLAPASQEEDLGALEHPHAFDSFKIQSRRDGGADGEKGNHTITDHRPLFEKYQFFTPGLFMGLLVTLLLLSILFVALRAISSLEVSYAAFEKEMGPQKGGKAQ